MGRHPTRPPKRTKVGVFSLSHRQSLAEPASQPPTPNKLCVGGWEVKEWRWDREKQGQETDKVKKRWNNAGQEVEVVRVVPITRRDEQLVQWLSVVRLADMHAVLWAMGGLNDMC